MRYMFTTKPDEGCHEVESGIYGRPVQTSDEPKLRKAGWAFTVDSLRGTGDVRQRQEEGREEEVEVSDAEFKRQVNELEEYDWALKYENKFGKKPHHKMKLETIKAKVKSDD